MGRLMVASTFALAVLLSVGEARATLISHWVGEGDATDGVGPNSGTLVDGVGFVPGVVGQVFHFDGTSYLTAPTTRLPTGNQDRTIDLWFQVDSYSPAVEEAFLAGYGTFGSFGQAYAILVSHFNILLVMTGLLGLLRSARRCRPS